MQSQRYPKAPITEAVIDLRVVSTEGMNSERLLGIHDLVRNEYPKWDEMYTGFFRLDATTKPPKPEAANNLVGYRFVSEDGQRIFVAQTEGFAHHMLAPYTCWEQFSEEGRRLWNVYRDYTQPQSVVRLALRYINRLDIPMPVEEMEKYLLTGPAIGPALAGPLTGMFLQLQMPQEDIKAGLVINQAVIPPQNETVLSVVLDIDVFRTVEIPETEEGIWECFTELRERKNRVFEGCITDATRSLFH